VGNAVLDSTCTGTVYGLFPGSLAFTANAQKGSTILSSTKKTVSLHAGKNTVALSFSSLIAPQNVLSRTVPSTAREGRVSTIYYVYYTWTSIPGAKYYQVINHNNHPQRTTPLYPYKTGDTRLSDKFLTMDDVLQKYGSNIFNMKPDEVILINDGGGYYNYSPGDTKALAEIQNVMDDLTRQYKDYYLEVFPME
jgi:hypothetical protein